MKKIIFCLLILLFSTNCFASQYQPHKLRMSVDDVFTVVETDEWRVEVQNEMPLRMADVHIEPRQHADFDMQLYFKCDTPDLAQFDTEAKMKQSIIASSQPYLDYALEDEVVLKRLDVAGRYGYYTVFTDKELANRSKQRAEDFKYISRGLLRLSDDSVLGFSLMTDEIDTLAYQKLLDYIFSFVKEKTVSEDAI